MRNELTSKASVGQTLQFTPLTLLFSTVTTPALSLVSVTTWLLSPQDSISPIAFR